MSHVSELYRTALRHTTYDEAIRYIITIDPMNWVLNGEAIRLNVKYLYEHIRKTPPDNATGKIPSPENDLIGLFEHPF